jgi:alcohol dehydrogenase (cytochrome c)/quinohemoprotein ethanol dehydrogenase
MYLPTRYASYGMVAEAGAMMGNQMLSIRIGAQPEFAPPVITAEERTNNNGLQAWNPVTRKRAWFSAQGSGGNNGVLSTAGNLVFQGNGNNLNAFSADKGERLWSVPVGAGIAGGLVTYSIDGVQYLAGVGSLGRNAGGRLVVYKLGGNVGLPPAPPAAAQPVLNPPANFGDEALLARGQEKYQQNCSICHENGRQMGGFPDLRYSPFINSDAAFRVVVLDGALTEGGMLSFAKALSADDAEAIRAHLVSLANTLKSQPARGGGPGGPGGFGGGGRGAGPGGPGGPGGVPPAQRPPQPGGGMGTLAAPGAASGTGPQEQGALHQ